MRGRESADPGAGPHAPILPLPPGLAEHRSHDYVRHGTTTLFAALEIATGQVIAACKPRHRHQEFLAWWLAILSQGESWHNLHHHADPTCARHGVLKGQVDVNAWLDVRRQMAEPGTPREKARVRMT